VLTARMPEGATRGQLPAMLQALLAERFKLVAHTETRIRPGYALVVDKNGPKFKESDPSSAAVRAGQIRFGAGPGASAIQGALTMAMLARQLSTRLDGPVQDLTGLKGRYDIDLSWVPDRSVERMGRFAQISAETHPESTDVQAGLPDAPTANIFTAMRDSLGLRLEGRKEPVETLVIDSIERVPAEN